MTAQQAKFILPLYWVACFLATHMPPPQIVLPSLPGLDKVVHFILYTGLGWMLATLLAPRFPRINPLVGRVVLALTAYAIFDELTQIPVGRTADLHDGFADIVGAAFGTLVVVRKRPR